MTTSLSPAGSHIPDSKSISGQLFNALMAAQQRAAAKQETSESIPKLSLVPIPDSAPDYADHAFAAINKCCNAYNKALEDATDQKPSSNQCETCARSAYRNAMPLLFDRPNIRAFIACVTRGILLRAIPPDEATKLLYASQIALNVSENPSAPPR